MVHGERDAVGRRDVDVGKMVAIPVFYGLKTLAENQPENLPIYI
jgi:hypothetical protein